jgi:hypothetical protein
MGTYRHKVASLINEEYRNPDGFVQTITSDIGLTVMVVFLSDKKTLALGIKCAHCALYNDNSDKDMFLSWEYIKEVYIRREDGISSLSVLVMNPRV